MPTSRLFLPLFVLGASRIFGAIDCDMKGLLLLLDPRKIL